MLYYPNLQWSFKMNWSVNRLISFSFSRFTSDQNKPVKVGYVVLSFAIQKFCSCINNLLQNMKLHWRFGSHINASSIKLLLTTQIFEHNATHELNKQNVILYRPLHHRFLENDLKLEENELCISCYSVQIQITHIYAGTTIRGRYPVCTVYVFNCKEFSFR